MGKRFLSYNLIILAQTLQHIIIALYFQAFIKMITERKENNAISFKIKKRTYYGQRIHRKMKRIDN